MGTISLRLPDNLDHELVREGRLTGRSRSEVVRDALIQYLAQQEHERFTAQVVAAARALAADPEARAEMLQLSDDFLSVENEALDVAEGRRPGEPSAEEQGERWWR